MKAIFATMLENRSCFQCCKTIKSRFETSVTTLGFSLVKVKYNNLVKSQNIVLISFNFLGEGLRDALDPTMKNKM